MSANLGVTRTRLGSGPGRGEAWGEPRVQCEAAFSLGLGKFRDSPRGGEHPSVPGSLPPCLGAANTCLRTGAHRSMQTGGARPEPGMQGTADGAGPSSPALPRERSTHAQTRDSVPGRPRGAHV